MLQGIQFFYAEISHRFDNRFGERKGMQLKNIKCQEGYNRHKNGVKI